MSPSSELSTRCVKLSRNLALLLLLLASACVPRSAPPVAPPPPGTAALPSAEPTVRVGLAVEVESALLSADRELELVVPGGGTFRRLNAGEQVEVSADAMGRLRVAGAPLPGGATLLTARPRGGGTVRLGDRSYRGEVVVQPAGSGGLTVVNRVEMEDYLLGVVPREIGRVGPERYEAVKAQAVAARTYAVRYLGRRESLGFDVFATVQDQVYGGVEDEYDLVTHAVRETAGEILVYEGRPIEAYYHSTCAGHTAAIHEVWNSPPIPYLRAVRDVDSRGQAYDHFSSRFRWTQRWSADELNGILSRTLADSVRSGMPGVGRLRDIRVLERTPSGRIGRMRITTTSGDFFVGGDRIRWIFLTPSGAILNSSLFDVGIERGAGGDPVAVTASGGGWGHGIGMCQVGAMGRAEAGQSYRTILETYYAGARLVDLY